MRWDRVIELVSVAYEQDADGVQRERETRRKVFANELSVGAEAFYAAAQAGHAIEGRYELRACDYLGERVAYVGGSRAVVSRVQSSGADYVRLDLERQEGES